MEALLGVRMRTFVPVIAGIDMIVDAIPLAINETDYTDDLPNVDHTYLVCGLCDDEWLDNTEELDN